VANSSIERKSLVGNTIEQLLQMADEFDAMAAGAATSDAKQALLSLGARFRVFASSRAAAQDGAGPVAPGKPAPCNGMYELRNAFGAQAGNKVQAKKGELLPRAPREFTWCFTSA